MEQVRDIVSMGSSTEQLKYELTTTTREERQCLLDTVLCTCKSSTISIPSEEVLAMKADLTLTWSKLRVLRRYSTTNNPYLYNCNTSGG